MHYKFEFLTAVKRLNSSKGANLESLAVSPDGTIYVVNTNQDQIIAIDKQGRQSTFATFDGKTTISSKKVVVPTVTNMTVLPNGTVVCVSVARNQIIGINPDGNLYLIAGGEIRGVQDGNVSEAKFIFPFSVTSTYDGKIVLIDAFMLRTIDTDHNVDTMFTFQENIRPRRVIIADGEIVVSNFKGQIFQKKDDLKMLHDCEYRRSKPTPMACVRDKIFFVNRETGALHALDRTKTRLTQKDMPIGPKKIGRIHDVASYPDGSLILVDSNGNVWKMKLRES